MSSPAQDSSQPAHNSVPEFLTGVVERITYHAEKSGYTVARIKSPRARDLITIVGNFADIQAGQTLQLNGNWKRVRLFSSKEIKWLAIFEGLETYWRDFD